MGTKRAVLWLAVSTKAQAEDDKISLAEQERASLEVCRSQSWQVVDTLRVRGHSRRYKSFEMLAEAALNSKLKIDAFHRLRDHWQNKDFDVLVCRDGDRFARSQSLFARIVEEVVETARAEIWSLADGLINQHNYRMWISMVGYRAAHDIDVLVAARRAAMNDYARRGLPTTSSVLWTHRVVRDELGKALAIVPDESKKRIVEDMARLIIEGHGWIDVSQMLYERFGHVGANGKPFPRGWAYSVVHNPLFWGHTARYHKSSVGPNGSRTDMWVFDDSEPVPEGVLLYRNTVPPALNGDLADQLQAELRRRRYVIRGKARPVRTRRFSGLFLCKTCGYSLVFRFNKGYPGYGCQSKYWQSEHRPDCPDRLLLSERKITDHIDGLLRLAVESADPNVFIGKGNDSTSKQQRSIEVMEKDVAELEAQARRLIQKQMSAPDTLVKIYDEELERLGERIANIQVNLQHTRDSAKSEVIRQSRARSFDKIREMGMDGFWALPDVEINQILHALMGNRRFVVSNGEFDGTTDMPIRRRR